MARTADYFQEKTIIITGAASGIGRATADIFGREGANVFCADIDEVGAAAAARAASEAGGKGVPMRVDVTSRSNVETMVARAKEEFGRIDFQFNSAGSIVHRCGFLDIDDEIWDKTFGLNVKGVFYSMQAVLPEMMANGRGVIVNMASMAHLNGSPGIAVHYGSSKGAVVSMSLGVAREFADRGIRCLSISPGPIDTPFQGSASDDLHETMRAQVPMGRFGRPEEIGEMVLFMCSDACEFPAADTVRNGGGGY